MTPKQKAILDYVKAQPSQTAAEIAHGVYGPATKQQTVFFDLRKLWRAGAVKKFTVPEMKSHRYAVPSAVPAGASLIAPKGPQTKQPQAARPAPDHEKLKRDLRFAADEVINRLLKNPNDRMHSWAHCFEYFHRFRLNVTDETTDLAALHLGFYLASYGMYRPKALLFRRDYRFLVPVVKELIQPSYTALGTGPNSVKQGTDGARAKQLWECCESLRQCLVGIGFEKEPSGTLVTKILLGTWCNVPAFDQVFKNAVKKTDLGNATYNKTNFRNVFAALHNHSDLMQEMVAKFHAKGFKHYPAMRVIDAVLWQFAGADKKGEQGKI